MSDEIRQISPQCKKTHLTHLGIEQMAKRNAADSLRREVPQAKANVSLWMAWSWVCMGGWGILITLGHPEFWVHCWNSSFLGASGMGNVFTVSA